MARPARGPGALCFLGSPRPRAQSFMPRPRAQSVQCFNAAGAQPPPRNGPGPGEAAPVAQREWWWLVGWLSCEVAQGPKNVLDWGLLRRPSSAVRRRIVVTSPVRGARLLQAGDAVTVRTSGQPGVEPRPGPSRLSPFRRGHCGPAGGRGAHRGIVVAAAGAALESGASIWLVKIINVSFGSIPDSLSVTRPYSGRVDPVVCCPAASRAVCRRTPGSSV